MKQALVYADSPSLSLDSARPSLQSVFGSSDSKAGRSDPSDIARLGLGLGHGPVHRVFSLAPRAQLSATTIVELPDLCQLPNVW